VSLNRTPAKAAYMRPGKGVLFLKGHISLKNWPKRLLLRHNTSSPLSKTRVFLYT
jgi:hypothetical protein